jgi:protein-tyrosine phosphatase
MNSHPFDVLDLEPTGRLIFTPCPGTRGVPLRESVAQLKQAGADAVITLMTLEEMARNDVETLPTICQELGLPWFHLPVEDDQAPTNLFDNRWLVEKSTIMNLVHSGNTVAIHCKGGSGRTGLMSAIILRENGVDLEAAINQVQRLRPHSLKLQPHLAYLDRLSN